MQEFFLNLLKTTALQILGVLGIFFAFGFVLSLLSQWTNTIYLRSVGWLGILWTAWIGTPFHELSHVLMAKLFGHTITNISLFSPNQSTGGLGHVEHSYNPKNIYQKIGNFFIGAAPMIVGSFILVGLLYFLVPNGKQVFSPIPEHLSSFPTLISSLKEMFLLLFSKENVSSWNFWLFIYISSAIATHIAPSAQDRKGMWSGFFWIVFTLLLFNAVALLFQTNITSYVLSANRYLGIFVAVFLYATILSLLHFLLASILLYPFKR